MGDTARERVGDGDVADTVDREDLLAEDRFVEGSRGERGRRAERRAGERLEPRHPGPDVGPGAIDVAALDVLDSFGSRTLRDLGQVARLRGAETVVVGIQPEVAFAMVRFGINLDPVHTALDLEEGLAVLDELGSCGAGAPRQAD